jgi:hypothetical protein
MIPPVYFCQLYRLRHICCSSVLSVLIGTLGAFAGRRAVLRLAVNVRESAQRVKRFVCAIPNKKLLTSGADFRTILSMTRKDIIKFFGSQAEAARRLGCKPQTIIEWELTGVPEGRQYQIELATGGKLRASKPADRKAPVA